MWFFSLIPLNHYSKFRSSYYSDFWALEILLLGSALMPCEEPALAKQCCIFISIINPYPIGFKCWSWHMLSAGASAVWAGSGQAQQLSCCWCSSYQHWAVTKISFFFQFICKCLLWDKTTVRALWRLSITGTATKPGLEAGLPAVGAACKGAACSGCCLQWLLPAGELPACLQWLLPAMGAACNGNCLQWELLAVIAACNGSCCLQSLPPPLACCHGEQILSCTLVGPASPLFQGNLLSLQSSQ